MLSVYASYRKPWSIQNMQEILCYLSDWKENGSHGYQPGNFFKNIDEMLKEKSDIIPAQ